MLHLRFTPYDISGYTFDFLELLSHKYIVAREDTDDDGNPLLHYHILIDTEYGIKSVRDAAKTALKIPPAGRGKNNAFYALIPDWKDPGYICKYNDVIRQKGYTEKEILDYVISGKKRYLDKVKEVELSGEKAPAAPSPKKPKPVPFQQAVIADAAADWYAYKRKCNEEREIIDISMVCDFICSAMVKNGRGINQYLVKELAFAVLHEDLDYRQIVINRVKAYFNS